MPATTRYKPYAYPSPNSSQCSSSSDAWSRRSRGYHDYWRAPEPAPTLYAGANTYDPCVIRHDTVGSTTGVTTDNQPFGFHSPLPHDTPCLTTPSSQLPNIGHTAEIDQLQHPGSPNLALPHQAACSPPGSQFYEPESTVSSFVDHAYPEIFHPTERRTSHIVHPTAHSHEPVETFPYGNSYHQDATPTYSCLVPEEHGHPTYTSSCYAQPLAMIHGEHRCGAINSRTADDALTYRARDLPTDVLFRRPTYGLRSATSTPPAAATLVPAEHLLPYRFSQSPGIHTNSRRDPLASYGRYVVPCDTVSSPPVPGTGFLEQMEQNEEGDPSPKRASKHTASHRHSSNQRDDTDDISQSTGTSASKKRSAKSSRCKRCKTGCEQVRLERDFYENCTASLLHQVKVMGGDPLQASQRAQEGQPMDLYGARLVVASSQRDTESLREKLIEAQTEIHRLRDVVAGMEQHHHSLIRESSIPLSAAPTTVYAHLNR